MQNQGKSALGLDANVVGMLCYIANICCYLGLILSIITVVTDKTNKLARFHAFQSIMLSCAGLVIGILINVLNAVAIAADSTGLKLLVGGVGGIIGLVFLVAVIYTAIQAYQNKIFKLPVIGDMAEKWA